MCARRLRMPITFQISLFLYCPPWTLNIVCVCVGGYLYLERLLAEMASLFLILASKLKPFLFLKYLMTWENYTIKRKRQDIK